MTRILPVINLKSARTLILAAFRLPVIGYAARRSLSE
jgi:hypothetical protein